MKVNYGDKEDELKDENECVNKVLNYNDTLMLKLVEMECTLLEMEHMHKKAGR